MSPNELDLTPDPRVLQMLGEIDLPPVALPGGAYRQLN